MKATLRRFERDAKVEEEQTSGMFGRKQMVKVTKHQIGVSLIIELYGLKELIVEDEPAWTPEEAAQHALGYTNQFSEKEKQQPSIAQSIRENEQLYRNLRRQVKLGEYLKSPYDRLEKSLYAAGQTYDLLKTKVLPTIAHVIATHKTRPVTETFEF
jgi:hypothetical protein